MCALLFSLAKSARISAINFELILLLVCWRVGICSNAFTRGHITMCNANIDTISIHQIAYRSSALDFDVIRVARCARNPHWLVTRKKRIDSHCIRFRKQSARNLKWVLPTFLAGCCWYPFALYCRCNWSMSCRIFMALLRSIAIESILHIVCENIHTYHCFSILLSLLEYLAPISDDWARTHASTHPHSAR